MSGDGMGRGATLLVIPCYNEAQRFPVARFAAFLAGHPEVQLLLVDDGSHDETLAVLEALRELAPNGVVVMRLERNGGKAEAVRVGMQRATAMGARYAGYWDADLATPLAEVSGFAAVLDREPGIDLVMGSRVRLLGRVIERRAVRHYLGRVFATAASLTLRLPVYDTQCGAKLFRLTPRVAAVFAEPFLARWIFDVEILARLGAAQAQDDGGTLEGTVVEYPLQEWRDQPGSKRRAGDLVRAFLDLVRIWMRYRR